MSLFLTLFFGCRQVGNRLGQASFETCLPEGQVGIQVFVEPCKGWAIWRHKKEQNGKEPDDISRNYKIVKKFQNKLDCLNFWDALYYNLEAETQQMVWLHPLKIICVDILYL